MPRDAKRRSRPAPILADIGGARDDRPALADRPRGRPANRRAAAQRRGAGHGLSRPDRGARGCRRRVAMARSRPGAGRSAAARRRGPARSAPRHPDRGQGFDRHVGHADRLRLADLSRAPPAGRRVLRGAGAGRGCGRARQDRHHRIRLRSLRAKPRTRTTRRIRRAARRAARPPRSPTAWRRSALARRPRAR